MTHLQEFLAEVEARANAASPAPWHIGHISEFDDCQEICAGGNRSIGDIEYRQDASFILQSRTDIPLLVQMLRVALEALIKTTHAATWFCDGPYGSSPSMDSARLGREALAELERLASPDERRAGE